MRQGRLKFPPPPRRRPRKPPAGPCPVCLVEPVEDLAPALPRGLTVCAQCGTVLLYADGVPPRSAHPVELHAFDELHRQLAYDLSRLIRKVAELPVEVEVTWR
jgi:transcription initiation factor TFIIIB Brf1 subunit/transcription initiation factor TFIIB